MTFQELMGSFYKNETLCNQKTYDALLAQMGERVTPVIGAGLSHWAGYPLWRALLSQSAKDTSAKTKVTALLDKLKYEEAATELEKAYRANGFLDLLGDAYSPEKLKEEEHPPWQRKLSRLFPGPFVTTNFDVSLERLLNAPLVITPESDFTRRELQSRIQLHKRVLIKLHGTVEDPEHMILTRERYNEVYGDDPENPDLSLPLPAALQKVFNGAPPLFLGCGLGPDRTCAVLRACKGASGFALLELPPETENKDNPFQPRLYDGDEELPAFAERRDFTDGLNLKVIWYPYNRHEAAAVLIEQLAKDIPYVPTDIEQREIMEETRYQGARFFIGRDAQVREVAQWLGNPDGSVFLVHGMAGIGKTEICKAAFREVRRDRPAFAMPMIDMAEASSVPRFLDCLALCLGHSVSRRSPEETLPFLLQLIRSAGEDEKPIVYLDNFEEALPEAEAERRELFDVMRRLNAVGLRLLISSQVRIPADHTLPVGILDGDVDLKGMEWDAFRNLDRVQLFIDTLGREAAPAERPALIRLIDEMKGHPLSIVLTAGFARDCGSLDRLLEHWHEIEDPDQADPGRHRSLTHALALSWNAARQSRAAAFRWALHAYSLGPLDPDTVQELRGELPETFTEMDWLEGERRLRRLGLIDAGGGAEGMLLPVKKTFPRLEGAQPFDRAALAAWTAWGGALLKKGDDRSHPAYLSLHSRALAYLPQCWHLAGRCLDAGDYDSLERLMRHAGNHYQYDISGAVPLLRRMLCETPGDFQLHGHFNLCLGILLARTGKPEESLRAFAEAERLYKDARDNLGCANVLFHRGDLLLLTGKTKEALRALAEAERLFRDAQDNLGRANVLRARGELLRLTGKPEEALDALAEAERLYKDVRDDLGRANVLLYRGALLRLTGKSKEALEAFAEAERLYNNEQNDLGRANVLFYRGNLLRSKRDWVRASKCYEEAVSLYRELQAPRGLCYGLANLQFCKKRLGLDAEAAAIADEVLTLLPGQPEDVREYVLEKINME